MMLSCCHHELVHYATLTRFIFVIYLVYFSPTEVSVCFQLLGPLACWKGRKGGGRGARVCTVADIVINRNSKSERSLRRQHFQTKEHQKDETKTKEARARNQKGEE